MNNVRFLISEEEDLASGTRTRLDHSRATLIKGTEKASDIDIRRGMENAPLASLIKTLPTFFRPTPTTYILNEQDENEQ